MSSAELTKADIQDLKSAILLRLDQLEDRLSSLDQKLADFRNESVDREFARLVMGLIRQGVIQVDPRVRAQVEKTFNEMGGGDSGAPKGGAA